MRKHLPVFIAFILLLGACTPQTDPTEQVAPILGPTPTPNLGEPDGVANAFLTAWMTQNYEGMYSLLTPNSQAEYSLEEFTNLYTGTATAMTLINLEAAPLSSLRGPNGRTAEVRFRVTYHTQVLGSIEENITMNLSLPEDRWSISWSPGLIFPELSGGNTIQLEIETPARANIYDRNGQSLVVADASTVTINIVPGEISVGVEGQMLELLATLLRSTPDDIRARYAGMPSDWWIPLGDADSETVQANYTALSSYPGIHTTTKSGRRYFNVLAPHVLGYTGFVPAEQLEEYQSRGYQGDEIIGLTGLERWGESYLAGQRGGVLSVYDPSGAYIGEIARHDPQPSQSLYATLDRRAQTIVQDAIEDAYEVSGLTWSPRAGGAAAVILDVYTGEVLAMASYPYFDPNVLNPYNNHPLYTDSYLSDLFNNPLRPFINRATQGVYPPGSLFKVIVMAAALDSGIFNSELTYNCTGVWTELGENDTRYDWKEGGHGELTLRQALTASCNTYFYHIGLMTGQEDYNIIPDMARQFGLGQELGLIIDESAGLVPDPEWLMQEYGEEWRLSDSINIAIGQGALQVSPLQMAVAISAIANGGTVYRPQLVRQIGLIGEDPSVVYEPEVIRTLSLSEDQLQAIREGMRGVAADPVFGTAQYRLTGMEIAAAGKTGTAQIGGEGTPPIAWFGGFAPYDNPEIAVVVMVENGGQGSAVAAPIFRRIVEQYFGVSVADYPPDWYNPQTFSFVDDIGE